VQTLRGEYAEAKRRYAEAIEILETQRGAAHIALVEALDGSATAAYGEGDGARSEALYRRALAIREQWLGTDHPAVAYQLVNRVAVLVKDEGRQLEALEHVERAVRILDDDQTPDHKRIAHARINLGAVLSKLDRQPEAEVQIRAAIAHSRLAGQADHPRVAQARFNLARVLEKQGRSAEALEQYRLAQVILDETEPTPAIEELKAKVQTRIGRLVPKQDADAVPSGPPRDR
jgi:tetratricopeptide (TPR) repeat protein